MDPLWLKYAHILGAIVIFGTGLAFLPMEAVSPAPCRVSASRSRAGLFGSGHERSVRARFAAARPSARLGR